MIIQHTILKPVRTAIYLCCAVSAIGLFSCKTTQPPAASKPAVSAQPSTKNGLSSAQRADVTHTFFNANKEKILGNYNTAAELFSEVIRKDPNNAAAMYELANIYVEQKKYSDALFFSKSAYKLDPSNTWYGLFYAEVLQRNKRFGEGADVLAQLVRDNPDRSDFYFELAEAYIYAEKPAEAIKTYDQLEKKIGVTRDVSVAKARLYQRSGKNDKAVEELKKLIASDPKDPQAYGMLAEVYQGMGDKQKALETYEELLKVDPENPFVHLSLADFYRTNGEKEKSVASLKKAFENPQLDIETKISILGSYYALVELHPELKEQALDMCKLLVKTHPSDPRSHAVYGDFLIQDKKYEEARAEYTAAKQLGSKEYSVNSQILLIDSQLQRWDSLLAESEEALTLFPDQPLVYFFNGLAKSQKKNYVGAVSSFNAGLKLVVDNVPLETQFYSSLGEAYNELKDYANSDKSFEKALELSPKDATVMNNYAYFLSVRGEKLDKAETLSRMSNELEPEQASFQDTYGWVMFKLGRYQEAKTWIEKSIRNTPTESATLLEHMGDVLYKLGDTQQALEYWQRAKKAGDGASELLDRKIREKKYAE